MDLQKAIEILSGMERSFGCANIMKEPLQVVLAALREYIEREGANQ